MIKTQNIHLVNNIFQKKGLIVSDMGEEKVILSVKNGKYYNLGEMGGEIWDLIEEPTPVKKVIEKLMSDYHVEQHECEEEVLLFLESLLKEQLIEIGKEQ
ncbi:lasso peptide biosynthesis PqqD family chaperone [Bacillus sp. T3]|uniref:lasso peptide biosynthesis PqqD family chaperone n=1 Tax=Bacillus sp. T3 TaxID=467262 RepID=UPI0029816B09|nr:lasso peptide biosynthesis PqqD family chaperone [Bacillus sp. T3]